MSDSESSLAYGTLDYPCAAFGMTLACYSANQLKFSKNSQQLCVQVKPKKWFLKVRVAARV